MAEPDDAPPPPLDGYVGHLLHHLAAQMTARVEAALEPLGIRARHNAVLTLVATAALSQVALSERLHVDRTTMVTIVDELEAQGLVIRSRDPHDRRAHAVTLTPTGRTRMTQAHERIAQAEASALAVLAPDEQAALRHILGILYAEFGFTASLKSPHP